MEKKRKKKKMNRKMDYPNPARSFFFHPSYSCK